MAGEYEVYENAVLANLEYDNSNWVCDISADGTYTGYYPKKGHALSYRVSDCVAQQDSDEACRIEASYEYGSGVTQEVATDQQECNKAVEEAGQWAGYGEACEWADYEELYEWAGYGCTDEANERGDWQAAEWQAAASSPASQEAPWGADWACYAEGAGDWTGYEEFASYGNCGDGDEWSGYEEVAGDWAGYEEAAAGWYEGQEGQEWSEEWPDATGDQWEAEWAGQGEAEEEWAAYADAAETSEATYSSDALGHAAYPDVIAVATVVCAATNVIEGQQL